MSTHNLCFEQKHEKYQNFLSENFHFLVVKVSVNLNRPVFVMRVCTSTIGRNPSPDLACAISEVPDVFREQIRKLLFKWHVHTVRMVRVNEQWMFRKVWAVYIGHVQMAKLQTSRDIHASNQDFTVGYFSFMYSFMYEQWGPRHVCKSDTRMDVCIRAEIFSFHFLLFYGCAYIIVLLQFALCGWMLIFLYLVVYWNYFILV